MITPAAPPAPIAAEAPVEAAVRGRGGAAGLVRSADAVRGEVLALGARVERLKVTRQAEATTRVGARDGSPSASAGGIGAMTAGPHLQMRPPYRRP